jgi:hypothetical protein
MPVTAVNRIAADLVADVLTDITSGGLAVDRGGSYTVRFVNRTEYGARIRLAITGSGGVAGGIPVNADYIEWNRLLEPETSYETSPIPIADGMRIYAYSDATNVSVSAHGRMGVLNNA